jgi:S-adenosylmethionine:tRNA ribosyltransferase-isomerase
MKPADFCFDLPAELIAQAPLAERGGSRLLHIKTDGVCENLIFPALADLLEPGDLLVLNDTRVLAARLFGRKDTGGALELLLERILDTDLALVQLKVSRAPAPGSTLSFAGGLTAVVEGRQGAFFVLRFSAPVEAILETCGHIPLPPYIDRPAVDEDRTRYQTVYARETGAVAAPTAGLHFDQGQLRRIRSQGVELGYLTLHVGAGTFQPLRKVQLETGKLHAERLQVSAKLCRQIEQARSRGSRVVAVGTTVVRGLETAAANGLLKPFDGETELFIRPGYEFRVVDALLTNFHLPESSLLMLVSAFAGQAAVLNAYGYAVAQGYRFFSYGDAMFCYRNAG